VACNGSVPLNTIEGSSILGYAFSSSIMGSSCPTIGGGRGKLNLTLLCVTRVDDLDTAEGPAAGTAVVFGGDERGDCGNATELRLTVAISILETTVAALGVGVRVGGEEVDSAEVNSAGKVAASSKRSRVIASSFAALIPSASSISSNIIS